MPIALCSGVWIIMITSGRGMFDSEIFFERGVLFTDAVAIFFAYYMNLAVMLFMVYMYWRKSAQFNNLIGVVCDLPSENVDRSELRGLSRYLDLYLSSF